MTDTSRIESLVAHIERLNGTFEYVLSDEMNQHNWKILMSLKADQKEFINMLKKEIEEQNAPKRKFWNRRK